MKAIVTGAAGFAGYHVTTHLLEHGYEVYAVVRPGSSHNDRLNKNNKRLHIVELDCKDYSQIAESINEQCDIVFHLAWAGGRDDFYEQYANIEAAVQVVETAAKLGCKRLIGIGSQAEYGIVEGLITEDLKPNPINAYGAAKVAAMQLTKRRCEQLGIEWIWGRIFSLYGKYEPAGRMLPDLIRKLKNGETVCLSDCTQNWDYLDASDAAEAIIALGETGHAGEIYNIANGDYRPLKEFVEEVRTEINKGNVVFGDRANPFISLQPCVEKIYKDTGWKTGRKDLIDGYR